jgi:lysophospholipase L1-like esterase
MKKLFSVIAAMLLLCSCSKTITVAEDTIITEETAIMTTTTAATATLEKFYENVLHIGRTAIHNDVLYLALSGSGAAFTASGSSISVTFTGGGSAAIPNNEGNLSRVGIFVNGERVEDFQMDEPQKTVTVLLSGETSEVRIIKLSESAQSVMGISDITVTDGGITPAEAKPLLIEFIGDSITCGYGVDDPDRDHHFSTATEDFTKTYAYKTVTALGADYSAVSYSGYGIISGYSGDGLIHADQTVPPLYEKFAFSYDSLNGVQPQSMVWDFNTLPDIVVINLGTNDDSYCGSDKIKQNLYSEKYTEFLKTVREKNPQAAIVCTLGIMGDNLYPAVEKAVEDYKTSSGDENVFSMKFDVQNPADGYAADWHPSETTHTKAAEKLTAWIKDNLNIN